MPELWTHAVASPRGVMKIAADLEAKGWDGLCVVDSQNLSGDPFVALAMAATVTERIGLGTGVSNSVTRMAAATASAIVSVDRVSDGRALIGLGRGDSALAHLGRAPARMQQFETYLRHLQTYLRGEAVPFDEIEMPDSVAPSVGHLGLADEPEESRITWLPPGGRKVPLEVAASGPRAIAVAARHADRIMFTLGADVDRLAWGIDLARTARREAGLDPDGIAYGAYINCVPGTDIDLARDLARGGLATFARFSVMHGKPNGPLSPQAANALQTLYDTYDMNKHTQDSSRQAAGLTPEFIDHFAVVGQPDRCVAKLQKLAALGLDKLFFGVMFRLIQTPEGRAAKELMEREILPALRSAA